MPLSFSSCFTPAVRAPAERCPVDVRPTPPSLTNTPSTVTPVPAVFSLTVSAKIPAEVSRTLSTPLCMIRN